MALKPTRVERALAKLMANLDEEAPKVLVNPIGPLDLPVVLEAEQLLASPDRAILEDRETRTREHVIAALREGLEAIND